MSSTAPSDNHQNPEQAPAREGREFDLGTDLDTDRDPGYRDLGFARLDTQRPQRTGDPEVVFGNRKTPQQIVRLLRTLREAHPDRAAFATRLEPEATAALRSEFDIEYDRTQGSDAESGFGTDPRATIGPLLVDEEANAATLGPLPPAVGRVCVLAAGTTDLPVAAEAALTARVYGANVQRIVDVGVAGPHRLAAETERIQAADCLIVVAGMEGALPSVVGGSTGVPLVAVPTSVGYGASFGGLAALLAMLNSCAAGVVVTNIDNGFGAGVHAARVARTIGRARGDVPSSPG